MNWITNFVKPKIQALMERKNDVPENLWQKCPGCEHMLFHRDLKKNHQVCHHCNHHLGLDIKDRFNLLFDNQDYTEVKVETPVKDPLKFKDSKKYTDRLKDYRNRTGKDDSVSVAYGSMMGQSVVVACFNFNFMGGSMGSAAGEAIVKASEMAVRTSSSLLVVTASGGARMQEGIISLMQMPRTTIAVQRVKEAGLPYITLLTNPTMGGVSASFAMLGDIAISEPGAIIGFAGRRVVEETIRQQLPDDFQTADYLYDHGMIDMVVHRHELQDKVGTLIEMLRVSKK